MHAWPLSNGARPLEVASRQKDLFNIHPWCLELGLVSDHPWITSTYIKDWPRILSFDDTIDRGVVAEIDT